MERELSTYEHSLEDEMRREKDRHARNVEALNKRKEEMVREKKQKVKVKNPQTISL